MIFDADVNAVILCFEMLRRNILLQTEIQIDNAQKEAAGRATIEQMNNSTFECANLKLIFHFFCSNLWIDQVKIVKC